MEAMPSLIVRCSASISSRMRLYFLPDSKTKAESSAPWATLPEDGP